MFIKLLPSFLYFPMLKYSLSNFIILLVNIYIHIDIFTNVIPLEIEHIDGNYLNNRESNLTLLCPNCHSLTATYKGANQGNGRKDRKRYSLYGNPELGK